MKKKIIIAGTILVVLVGGVGIKFAHSYIKNKATHTSSNSEYYYNNSDREKDNTSTSSELRDGLPSRDEVITTPDSIYCLVNKEYSLPSDYEPSDLVVPDVSFNIEYESEKRYMRKEAALALETLCKDALSEGLEIFAISGYRSYERQQEIYENNLKTRGSSHTNQYSAKPGYSEHQTGLVMDVSCESEHYDLQESFGETPEGIWLANNCAKYGYIIRYPEGKEDITGYAYEPWHIRYVGIKLATYLTENNLTLDEYYYYEPSFDFITDESEYINDTPSYSYNSDSTTLYSPAPSASANTSYNQNDNSGNTGNTNTTNNNNSSSNTNTTTTVSPSTPTVSVKPSVTPTPEIPEVDTEVPEESEPAATETPSPSASTSPTPSIAPSQPAPSASASAPSTEQQPDENEDETIVGESETIIE